MSNRLTRLRKTIEAHGQSHLLRFHDALDPQQRARLLDQLEAIDFPLLAELARDSDGGGAEPALPADLEPAPCYGLDLPEAQAARYRARGAEAVRAGAVAAFTVAGGQGTRLGWNGPKGTFPATPVTGKPLFRCFAEQILAARRRYGATIPWYIMTSRANDAETRAFFLDNNCFGLVRNDVFMFPQAMMPSLEPGTGRLLLAARDAVAMNPDGHGGSIRALRESGAVEDMRGRGIEHISYFQVDNPLVKVIDPLFIGLHLDAPDSSAEMSSKMVAKTDPAEPVGVFARSGGRTRVIEYTFLPEALAQARDERGRLRFGAGSIAVHLLGRTFVERLTSEGRRFALPYHRAVKKTPTVDPGTGEAVVPREPNAIKLETFVFDALPLAESSIVMETERSEEFAPIKNATGADSPATSHRLQSDRAGRWLESRGVLVPRDEHGHVSARLEISPLTALEPSDLAHIDLPQEIAPGLALVIEPGRPNPFPPPP